jgi:CRISPR-associated protein Cas5d
MTPVCGKLILTLHNQNLRRVQMGCGIKIIIEGDYAMFSRPEMKVERVSYDVPTPSALVGLISGIYWHPGVKYIIDRIHVLKPIQFVNIRRNEVSEKLLPSAVKKQMDGLKDDISIYTKDCISQRASLLLKDVQYGVEAHFELTEEKDEKQIDSIKALMRNTIREKDIE